MSTPRKNTKKRPAKKRASSEAPANKDAIYEAVTEKVIAMLESGTAPWRKPWHPGQFPRNIDGYRYRGVNVFLLWGQYESPFWMTFNQAKARGGTVKKGEKSTMIVFWKRLTVREKDEVTGQYAAKSIPLLRYYRVFNVEQTEGVKLPKAVTEFDASQTEHADITDAEAIMRGYPDRPFILETDSDQAYYLPSVDQITLPRRRQFAHIDEFYSTAFHEMGHSTGHPSRLNRKQSGTFGSHDYGREELVAEMTAAFLCGEAGITLALENSAAYLQSWIRTIKEDVRAVVVAAGQAQRAADHILGRKFDVEEKPPVEGEVTPADAQELAVTA